MDIIDFFFPPGSDPAIMAIRGTALESAWSNGLFSRKHNSGDGWGEISPCFWDLQREATQRFSSFRQKQLSIKGIESIDFFDMRNRLPLLTTSACESLRAINNQLFSFRRGIIL